MRSQSHISRIFTFIPKTIPSPFLLVAKIPEKSLLIAKYLSSERRRRRKCCRLDAYIYIVCVCVYIYILFSAPIGVKHHVPSSHYQPQYYMQSRTTSDAAGRCRNSGGAAVCASVRSTQASCVHVRRTIRNRFRD
jgi:hypothetical protein